MESGCEPIALPFGLEILRRFPFPRKLGVLERLYGKQLARSGVAWVRTAAGPHWKLNLHSSSHRWIVYGDYEGPRFLTWARGWLNGGGTVIDSGANIGQTLLYFAMIPAARVIAFEPNPASREWLEECVACQSGWQVQIVPWGLSGASDTALLQLPKFADEEDAQATLHTDWYLDRSRSQVQIQLCALDDFMASQGIDRVRLWKLDVEGWEFDALSGARGMLRDRRIDAIFVELHPSNAQRVRALLGDLGYRLYTIEHGSGLRPWTPGKQGTVNVLAIPS